MPKTRELTQAERGQIVLLHSQKMTLAAIARQMKCSRCAVRTTIKRHQETGSFINKPKSGRKRVTTAREDRLLERISLRDRRKSSKELASELLRRHRINVSAQTVRRRLASVGLRGCKARHKPHLTETHKKKRLLWAKKYQHWTVDDWAKILWSDESNIELFGQPGAQYVRRRPGEAYNPDCVIPTMKYGGGSIMVWGCMSASGVGELYLCEGRMNSRRYIAMLEKVLEPSALKLFDEDISDYHFQQDNAPCHKSREVMRWFSDNGVRVLEWPPQSPDLSPIEHLWHILKVKVSKFKCSSKEELKVKIFEAWNTLKNEDCYNLVASMPKRIRAVIKARGGVTKY